MTPFSAQEFGIKGRIGHKHKMIVLANCIQMIQGLFSAFAFEEGGSGKREALIAIMQRVEAGATQIKGPKR